MKSLIVFALIAEVALGCPATTTTTPCPTSTCPSGQSCAATACSATQSCFNNNQYNLCQVTTSASTGVGVNAIVVKFCSSNAGDACNLMFTPGIQVTATPNTFNTFAACCAAATPSPGALYYDTYDPPGAPVNNLYCLGSPDVSAYKTCVTATGGAGTVRGGCVRFPSSCATGQAVQYISPNVAAPTWTTTAFTSFGACCNAAPTAPTFTYIPYTVTTGTLNQLFAASGSNTAVFVDSCQNV